MSRCRHGKPGPTGQWESQVRHGLPTREDQQREWGGTIGNRPRHKSSIGGLTILALAAGEPTTKRLFADYWEHRLGENPEEASHLGDRRFNDRWQDVGLAAHERRHKAAKEFLARAEAIDAAALPPADRLNLTLFRKMLADGIAEEIRDADEELFHQQAGFFGTLAKER